MIGKNAVVTTWLQSQGYHPTCEMIRWGDITITLIHRLFIQTFVSFISISLLPDSAYRWALFYPNWNPCKISTFYRLTWQFCFNFSFKERMDITSENFRDQPIKPLDRAVYWVDYVLRHKSLDHLHPGSLQLSWYQLNLIDVMVFLVISVIITLTLIYQLVKRLVKFTGKRKLRAPIKRRLSWESVKIIQRDYLDDCKIQEQQWMRQNVTDWRWKFCTDRKFQEVVNTKKTLCEIYN